MSNPYRFVAISSTADMGRFVLYIGGMGETRDDVTQAALRFIEEQTMFNEVWQREAREQMRVMSVSNARRLYSRLMRDLS